MAPKHQRWARFALRPPGRNRILYDYAENAYLHLMRQDWVTRHELLAIMRTNDPTMYIMIVERFLSPTDGIMGMATGQDLPRRGGRPIVLTYARPRRLTICRMFNRACRCTVH